MKLVWASIAVAVAVVATVVAHFVTESRELRDFCQSLPVGMAITEVREAATEKGFDPRMEPYSQMRIEPTGWHYARPSCRVFFNKDRTIEYRVFQKG